jgi:hypothetical protein
MVATLLHENGRTDGHEDVNSRFSHFSETRLKTEKLRNDLHVIITCLATRVSQERHGQTNVILFQCSVYM